MKSFFLMLLLITALCAPFSLKYSGLETHSVSAAVNLTHDYKNPLLVNSFSAWFEHLLVSIQGIVGWLAVIMLIVGGMFYMTSGGSATQAARGKAIVITSLIGFAVAVAAPSLLREIKDLASAGAGGGAPSVIANAKTIQEIVIDVMNFLLVAIGVLSLISFVYGGFTYITSGGDGNKANTGKSVVTYSIIAICLAGASLIILKQVLAILG